MKKILILLIMGLLLNGCRYVNTKQPYLDAKESKELIIPEGSDKPNAISTLDVPKARTQGNLSNLAKSPPPDMPIRTRQSNNGDVRIENIDGYPVLLVKTEVLHMFEAMSNIELENWSIESVDKDNCLVTLKYNDLDARDRENAGFFKRLITRENLYIDYTGNFKLSCKKQGSLVLAKFSKIDNTTAKPFLADNVMNTLYEKFK